MNSPISMYLALHVLTNSVYHPNFFALNGWILFQFMAKSLLLESYDSLFKSYNLNLFPTNRLESMG